MGKLSYGTTGLSYECNKVQIRPDGAPRCPRCQDRVYHSEERRLAGQCWHKRCFACVRCKKSLDSTNCNSHDNEVYCNTCHRREFGPKGYGFAGGASGLSSETAADRKPVITPINASTSQTVTVNMPRAPKAEISSANASTSVHPAVTPKAEMIAARLNADQQHGRCPRCDKRVYFAEEVKALSRSWHKLCFTCGVCRTPLDAVRCNEHEGQVYCQPCYGRRFGPKGYGFAGGASTLLAVQDRLTIEGASHASKAPYHRENSTNGETWTESVFI